jgi:hypothetical protein
LYHLIVTQLFTTLWGTERWLVTGKYAPDYKSRRYVVIVVSFYSICRISLVKLKTIQIVDTAAAIKELLKSITASKTVQQNHQITTNKVTFFSDKCVSRQIIFVIQFLCDQKSIKDFSGFSDIFNEIVRKHLVSASCEWKHYS